MSFRWIGRTLDATARRGLDVETLLLESGIGAGHNGPIEDVWFDAAEYMLMCALVINAVEDEMHDTARARMRPGTAFLGARLVASASTLGDAIDTLVRLFDIAGTFCLLRTRDLDGDLLLTIQVDVEDPAMAPLVEEMTATYLHTLFSYYLGSLLPLAAFYTPAADHPNLATLHPYLSCPVCYASMTGMRIERRHLSRPAIGQLLPASFADAALAWISYGARGDVPGDGAAYLASPFSAQVYDRLFEGDMSFDQCSAVLGLVGRDLRAGLLNEGNTFRQIRRTALLARARRFLDTTANTDDVALALGYSDARSLRRAIKLAGGPSITSIRELSTRPENTVNAAIIKNIRYQYSLLA